MKLLQNPLRNMRQQSSTVMSILQYVKKTHHIILGISVLILLISYGCDEEDSCGFSIEIRLVDETGSTNNVFSQYDSIRFDFYLTNHSGMEATYLRPCPELGDYLNFYKEDAESNYAFYGQPSILCPAIAIFDKIQNKETKYIGGLPWIGDFGFPQKDVGNYYVGDLFTLIILDSAYEFMERVYFEIE